MASICIIAIFDDDWLKVVLQDGFSLYYCHFDDDWLMLIGHVTGWLACIIAVFLCARFCYFLFDDR